MSEARIANLIYQLNRYEGVLKDTILDSLPAYFPTCANVACATSDTVLLSRGEKSFRGVNSNKALTLAERLNSIGGYSLPQIEAGLEAMLDRARNVQGGRKSLLSFAVGGLSHCFNRDCAGGLGELSAIVDKLVNKAGTPKGDTPPAVARALKMLEAGGLVADKLVSLKKMAEEEKKLEDEIIAASGADAVKAAVTEYKLFKDAFTILLLGAGQSTAAIKNYLTNLQGEAKAAETVGASSGAGGASGASGAPVPAGGRHGSSKEARREALKTALLVGDVKYLAMLDMTNVKLSAAERMVAAQTAAQYRGESLDKFEAGIHSALGGRGVTALRVAGLL
jgi:hypothetical protein